MVHGAEVPATRLTSFVFSISGAMAWIRRRREERLRRGSSDDTNDLLMVSAGFAASEPVRGPPADADSRPTQAHENGLEESRVCFSPCGVRQPDW